MRKCKCKAYGHSSAPLLRNIHQELNNEQHGGGIVALASRATPQRQLAEVAKSALMMSVCALCARPGGSAGVPAVFFPIIVALRSTLRTSPNPRLSTPFRVQRKPPAGAQSNNNSATTDKPLLELGGGTRQSPGSASFGSTKK